MIERNKAEELAHKIATTIWNDFIARPYNAGTPYNFSFKQLKQVIQKEVSNFEERESDTLKYEIAELEERVNDLQNTCIELSKKAVYTDEEKERYWEFECECGFSGLSSLVFGGNQIADTGDYGDCYCPCCRKVID